MKTLLVLLLMTTLAGAQTNLPPPTVNLPTNKFMKIDPLWQPTKGQLACGTNYFGTEVNEFDRIIAHKLFNLKGDFGTFVTRRFTPGGPSEYRLLVVTYSRRRHVEVFTTERPLEFLVDGTRFSYSGDSANIGLSKFNTTTGSYHQEYFCMIDETLVRALGEAGRASIRIPTKVGNVDHNFDAVELRRFQLFAQNFLPAGDAVLNK